MTYDTYNYIRWFGMMDFSTFGFFLVNFRQSHSNDITNIFTFFFLIALFEHKLWFELISAYGTLSNFMRRS